MSRFTTTARHAAVAAVVLAALVPAAHAYVPRETGQTGSPARSTIPVTEPGAATRTSSPARRQACAKGSSGSKWPAPRVVVKRMRMALGTRRAPGADFPQGTDSGATAA